jgi:hypothetical protein
MLTDTIYKKSFFFILSAIVIGALWYFQSLILVNVPFWDDFHGIILPVYDMLSDIPLYDKLVALFSQNNEHRIANDRLFMWVVYLIKGNFDMRFMALLGFLNLIGIFWIFIKVFQNEKVSLYFLIPPLFFLFQPQYFESLQSLMVPFQNFSVIFYAFLAFYLVIYKNKFSYPLAFFLSALAFYTHGNGVFVFIICAIIIFLTAPRKHFILWVIFSTLAILSYFYHYKKPDWNASSSPLERPVESFFYFFEFLGSFGLTYVEMSTTLLNSSLKKIFPTVLGFLISGWFIYVFFKNNPVKFNLRQIDAQLKKLGQSRLELFVLACIFFFLFTGVILAAHRTGFPIMSRYTINSALMVAVVYMYLVYHASAKGKKVLFNVFTLIGISYLCLSYYNNWDLAIQKRKLGITDGINWEKNRMWTNQYFSSEHTKNLNHLLDKPYDEKMYFFPESGLDMLKTAVYSNKIAPVKTSFDGFALGIVDTEQDPWTLDNESGIYYLFENEKYSFIIPGFHIKNGFLNFLTTGKYYSGVVKSNLSTQLVPNEKYEIIRVDYKKGQLLKTKTGQFYDNKNYGADAKN